MEKETYIIYVIENAIEEDEDEEEMTIGGVHNHDFQNKKWKSLWLYMRLLDVKRFLLTILPFYSSPHQITFRSTSLKCEILKLFYQRLVGCLSRGSEGYAQKSRFFPILYSPFWRKVSKPVKKSRF